MMQTGRYKRMIRKKGRGIALSMVLISVTGMVTILLLVFLLCLSFFGKGEFQQVYQGNTADIFSTAYSSFRLIPKDISGEQYVATFWSNSDFWYHFWNTVGISLAVIVGTVIVGSLGGYAFARYQFFGKNILLYLFILIMMVPYQVLMAPQFRLIYEMNLLNKAEGIILPSIFAPLGTYLIYQYVLQLPEEQFEAARVDGAGELRIFCRIALPQMKNGIMSLVLLVLIDTWNLVEQPLIFLSDEYRYPLSVAIEALENSGNLSFAACIVFVFPLFMVFLLGKDWLIQGIGHSVVTR